MVDHDYQDRGEHVAKKGFGKIMSALGGSPYEKLLKRIEKGAKEFRGDDRALSRLVKKMVREIQESYSDENIDAEEHDLLMEELEDIDPEGRELPKLDDDDGELFDSDNADDPKLKSKTIDLDDLLSSKGDSFTSSYGRDEFEDFRQKMSQDFYADSDEAIAAGDHEAEIRTQTRVFKDEDADLAAVKQAIAAETGMKTDDMIREEEEEAAAQTDDSYTVDDDGTEWWQDDDGYWWFRPEGDEEWLPYDE